MAAAAASVLRNRNVFLFLAARFCSAMAGMMFSVAVGWQVYALTGSAFAKRRSKAAATSRKSAGVNTPPPS